MKKQDFDTVLQQNEKQGKMCENMANYYNFLLKIASLSRSLGIYFRFSISCYSL